MIQKATLAHLAKHLNNTSKIVMRADFNVPIKDSIISDLNRVKATVPSIKHLMQYNPQSIVLLSHLGRPNGERNPKYSLKPVVEPLQDLLQTKVRFLEDCVGDQVVKAVNQSKGEIFLCQNVRYHAEEEGSVKDKDGKKIKSSSENIKKFRQELSKLGNVFVNDAFGTAHRAHSSVVGLNHKHKVAGLLMQKQLQFLGGFLDKPKKPVLVILGGSKVTDKIDLILNMIKIADEIIIGGGMSNPFLRQFHNHQLGITRVDMPKDPNTLQQIMDAANKKGVKIHLPVDGVCAQSFSNQVPIKTFMNADVPDGWQIFDKGPKTVAQFDKVVQRANSIFWNGPIGVFQMSNFKNGSEGLLQSVIKRTKEGATSIIGGGDTASLVNNCGKKDEVSYVSTGGGATLEFMEGVKLPGVESLTNTADLV